MYNESGRVSVVVRLSLMHKESNKLNEDKIVFFFCSHSFTLISTMNYVILIALLIYCADVFVMRPSRINSSRHLVEDFKGLEPGTLAACLSSFNDACLAPGRWG